MSGFGAEPEITASEEGLILHMEDTAPLAICTAGSPNTVAAPARSLWQTDCIAVRLHPARDLGMARARRGGMDLGYDVVRPSCKSNTKHPILKRRHGEPDPPATFRFAEPVFIEPQQNFRVGMSFPQGVPGPTGDHPTDPTS